MNKLQVFAKIPIESFIRKSPTYKSWGFLLVTQDSLALERHDARASFMANV